MDGRDINGYDVQSNGNEHEQQLQHEQLNMYEVEVAQTLIQANAGLDDIRLRRSPVPDGTLANIASLATGSSADNLATIDSQSIAAESPDEDLTELTAAQIPMSSYQGQAGLSRAMTGIPLPSTFNFSPSHQTNPASQFQSSSHLSLPNSSLPLPQSGNSGYIPSSLASLTSPPILPNNLQQAMIAGQSMTTAPLQQYLARSAQGQSPYNADQVHMMPGSSMYVGLHNQVPNTSLLDPQVALMYQMNHMHYGQQHPAPQAQVGPMHASGQGQSLQARGAQRLLESHIARQPPPRQQRDPNTPQRTQAIYDEIRRVSVNARFNDLQDLGISQPIYSEWTGSISTPQQASEYLSQYRWQPEGWQTDTTIPTTLAQKLAYARQLYEAMTDFHSGFVDKVHTQNKVNRLVQHTYEQREIEARCIDAADRATRLHMQGSWLMPSTDNAYEPRIKPKEAGARGQGAANFRLSTRSDADRNLSFGARWEALCRACQVCKAVATDILDGDKMEDAIYCPRMHMMIKISNMVNNDKKVTIKRSAIEEAEAALQAQGRTRAASVGTTELGSSAPIKTRTRSRAKADSDGEWTAPPSRKRKRKDPSPDEDLEEYD